MKKKALIIDDTKNIRLMLAKCMEIEGYEIEVADNGKLGLEMASKRKYNLIFLDIKLPEISGTEVLRKLRGEGINTPVIIITAYPTVKNAVDCTQLGAMAYLQKPFTTERIRNVLSELNFDKTLEKERNLSGIVNEAISSGKFEIAMDELRNALSSSPCDSQIYGLFGKVYSAMGQDKIAEKFYKAEEIFK